MKKINLLCLVLVFLVASGCSKPAKETTITGQVRTFGTEEAVKHPPLKVVIYEKLFTSGTLGMGGTRYDVIAETMTDESAYFSLTTKLSPDKSYYLGVNPDYVKEAHHYTRPAWGTRDREDRKISQIGGAFQMNYYLTAKGWVRFHFVSDNYQPGDWYSYNGGGGVYERFEGPVNTFRILDFSGNLEHSIAFTTSRNNEFFPNVAYFFVSAFDTTDYRVGFK